MDPFRQMHGQSLPCSPIVQAHPNRVSTRRYGWRHENAAQILDGLSGTPLRCGFEAANGAAILLRDRLPPLLTTCTKTL